MISLEIWPLKVWKWVDVIPKYDQKSIVLFFRTYGMIMNPETYLTYVK